MTEASCEREWIPGQGDVRRYAFRVVNMGTLGPADMERVVVGFAEVSVELAGAEGRDR